MLFIRRASVTGALVAAVLLVVACGSSKSTATGSSTTTKAAAPATVAVGTTSLGPVLVDASGKTLYQFDHDTAGSGTSACTGACATTWPAAPASGTPTAGAGVSGTLAVITRTDGTMQLTLDGRPLYHFKGDAAAGDTNGNGIGGIWHVVTEAASTGASTSTSRGPGGY